MPRKSERHLDDRISQPVEVSLVIRQQDEIGSDGTIRCMNVVRSLKNCQSKSSRQILFAGEKLDMETV